MTETKTRGRPKSKLKDGHTSVSIDVATAAVLRAKQKELGDKLGFEPSLSQVVRHFAMLAPTKTEG